MWFHALNSIISPVYHPLSHFCTHLFPIFLAFCYCCFEIQWTLKKYLLGNHEVGMSILSPGDIGKALEHLLLEFVIIQK